MDGIDLREYNVQWLRKVVGIVGQEPVLFSGSIAENIGQAIDDATMDQIEEAAKSANAHNFISQFPNGYRTDVGEKGLSLSLSLFSFFTFSILFFFFSFFFRFFFFLYSFALVSFFSFSLFLLIALF